MRLLTPLLASVAMMSTAIGSDAITLLGPHTAAADGSPIVITVAGLDTTELSDEAWDLDLFPTQGAELSAPIRWAGTDYLLFRSTSPGSYQISLHHALAGRLLWAKHVVQVGPAPFPHPDPDPDPDPNPDPLPGPRWYTLIYETQTDGLLLADLLNAGVIGPALASRQSHWRAFDRDSLNSSDASPPEIAAYVDLAPDSGAWLVITAADGAILWQGVPPLTTAAILALVPFPPKATTDVN